jgi:hypothetical protein
MATRASQADVAPGLQREAIGLAPVLFQSITHMAPAAAVAFSIIFAVTYAGGATPLAVILALVACLLVAISISQLARHLPSAGGLYHVRRTRPCNAHGQWRTRPPGGQARHRRAM